MLVCMKIELVVMNWNNNWLPLLVVVRVSFSINLVLSLVWMLIIPLYGNWIKRMNSLKILLLKNKLLTVKVTSPSTLVYKIMKSLPSLKPWLPMLLITKFLLSISGQFSDNSPICTTGGRNSMIPLRNIVNNPYLDINTLVSPLFILISTPCLNSLEIISSFKMLLDASNSIDMNSVTLKSKWLSTLLPNSLYLLMIWLLMLLPKWLSVKSISWLLRKKIDLELSTNSTMKLILKLGKSIWLTKNILLNKLKTSKLLSTLELKKSKNNYATYLWNIMTMMMVFGTISLKKN